MRQPHVDGVQLLTRQKGFPKVSERTSSGRLVTQKGCPGVEFAVRASGSKTLASKVHSAESAERGIQSRIVVSVCTRTLARLQTKALRG